MTEKVNLSAKLASFSEHFSPKIVAELNNYKIAVVKAKGEFVWHTHPDTDDFFLVLSGHLPIQLRDRDVEPKGTPNTGDAGGERTAVETRI